MQVKRSKREQFKDAIEHALELKLNEEGMQALAPYLGYKDMFYELQRSDWYRDLRPSAKADPLGIAAHAEDLSSGPDGKLSILKTVQATTNGTSILFWNIHDMRGAYDRIDLYETNPIIVALHCKLAGIHATVEPAVLKLPVPNPFWAFHPERLRCSRPHLMDLVAAPTMKERQKIMGAALDVTYSRWVKLKEATYEQMLEGMATQTEIEANYLDFDRAGRHIYQMAPTLIDMLRSSDIDDIPYNVIKLPHKAQYIHFGAQEDFLDHFGRPLEGVYICEGKDSIHFCFVFEAITVEDATAWILAQDPFISIELCPAETIAEAFSKGLAEMRVDIEKMKELAANDPSLYEPGTERWMDATFNRMNGIRCLKQLELTIKVLNRVPEALALAVNSLLFITTFQDDVTIGVPDSAPQKAKERVINGTAEQKARELRKLTNDGFVVVSHVGRSVTAQVGTDGAGSKKARRSHWRRGFWRMQRVGEGWKDQRLTWVRPTLVSGKDEPVERLGIIHKVESKD